MWDWRDPEWDLLGVVWELGSLSGMLGVTAGVGGSCHALGGPWVRFEGHSHNAGGILPASWGSLGLI